MHSDTPESAVRRVEVHSKVARQEREGKEASDRERTPVSAFFAATNRTTLRTCMMVAKLSLRIVSFV